MRMTRRMRRDDRGAVLIIAAAFMIVAVVFLAFVVDIGDQRQDRRQLATATDAAALAVADEWADQSLIPLASFTPAGLNQWDCSQAAIVHLNKNRAVDAGDYSCRAVRFNEQFASVSVFADGRTDYQIGQAVGVDDGPIGSTTSVRIRSTIGGGLRPFTICARDLDVQAWFNAGGSPEGHVITLGGDKFLPPECGQNNGNWGFVQFETQASGQRSLADVIRHGSSDPVASFDNGPQDPLDPYADEKAVCSNDADENPQTLYDEQDPVTCVFNDQGAAGWNNNNALDAFDYLRDNSITFSLPLYGEIEPIGNGQQTGFPIIGFAEVQLVDYDPAQGANKNEITLRFLKLTTGDCCDVNESNELLEICDVGTPQGAQLASFLESCQTTNVNSGPPGNSVPPPGCVASSVTPSPQSESLDANEALTQDVLFTLRVVNSAHCGTITARAVQNGNANPRPSATVSGPSGNDYSIRFTAGTTFKNNKTFTIEVSEDGGLLDDSGRLTTNAGSPPPTPPPAPPPPPCTVQSVSPSSQQVAVGSGNSGTANAVSYDITVADINSCNGLSVRVISGNSTPATVTTNGNVVTATIPSGSKLTKNKTYVVEVIFDQTVIDSSATLQTT